MIIIGEKINGAIPSVSEAIANKDGDFIKDLARKQADAGAHFIDVCASTEVAVELETMKWLIDLVQEATEVPIAVDSPSAQICAESIQLCNKPGLVNSVSMEGDKIEVIFPEIAGTEWEVVALLSDDEGIPQTEERRMQVFADIMEKAEKYGIDPSRLHVDPLVEMLCTSEDGINTVLQVIRNMKAQYPSIHVTGGASNISFNLPARKFVNQAFLVLAMGAGMDSAIINPLHKHMMGLIYATEALKGNDEYCIEYINAYRERFFGPVK
ncbi:5-methyltetrahydrofolate--homocysteine methyltransferase [Desulfosalsimonas propionicica]|uniref:5-methyltetrahydrofolate--homocysteine methyltransferase n=1 Tax=Desulfosalsimonas propionicica TaxID=332175 RepID=A0A7W0CBW8_9BACT|nr:5-methyltetrahydrofolate--homocysteine methyltransferase [Desulfosalsimonas propionicica]